MTARQQAILATLKYSDHFNFPLTLSELHARLIRHQLSLSQLRTSLAVLIKSQQVSYTKPYYHLPDRKHLVSKRLSRRRLAKSKLTQLRQLLPRLTKVPGVIAIFLTGSLAVHNSPAEDDFDLLIITKPRQLWLTRLLLTVFTQLLGVRRTPTSTTSPNQLCLNLYLTPDSLTLPPHKRSLYTAYELIQTTPLYDPHSFSVELLLQNRWLSRFLPNYPLPDRIPPPNLSLSRLSPLHLLEYCAYHLQRLYMRPKITRELITPNSAFFHPRDPSPPSKL